MRSFASDNNSGVHPLVMEALNRANSDHAVGYGDDPWTEEAVRKIREAFTPDCEPLFVFNGTGSNAVALQLCTRPYNSIICAETAHIYVDECGAPARMTGCQIRPIATPDGKLTPDLVRPYLCHFGEQHHSQPGAIYISQCSELGTVYKPDELRAYYKKWYRPDLQAIIVVGDVNVDQVEATIKKMFADVPAPVNPAKREQVSVPDNDLPLISIAKDKEASNTILYIFYKHDKLPNDLNRTIAGLVKDYIQQICASIMDERFDDILHQANPPFIYAQAYDDDNFMIAKSKGAWTVAALAKEGEIDSTLTTLVKETQRVKQYGFTPSEYERARINVLKQYESAYNERNNQKNDAYVREYVNHFTNGGYIPGIEMEYTLLNQIAQNIPVEQVNQYIQDMIGEDNIVIGLTGPDKEGIKYPTEENLLRTFLKARQMPVEPYKETVSNEPLVPTLPTPGQITETKTGQRFISRAAGEMRTSAKLISLVRTRHSKCPSQPPRLPIWSAVCQTV